MFGYAMSEHHDAALAVAALRMAAVGRGGNVDGVIFHSDRGSEYTTETFETACRRLGVLQSMGRGAEGSTADRDPRLGTPLAHSRQPGVVALRARLNRLRLWVIGVLFGQPLV